MYDFRILKTAQEMLPWKEQWNALWTHAHFKTPYQSFEWNYHWVCDKGQDKSLYIVLAVDAAGRLVGIAPLRKSFDCCSVAVLSFIGQEATVYPDFILRSEDSANILLRTVEFLHNSNECTALELKITEPSPSLGLLRDALGATSWEGVAEHGYTTRLRIGIGTDYENYLNSLSKKMRHSILYDTRKLGKHFEVTFRTDEERDHDACMMEICRLNTLKWGGDPVAAFSGYHTYHRSVRKRGGSRVFMLCCDGKIVAGTCASVLDDTIYLEIAGFDFSVLNVGLGKVLDSMLIRWAIENGLSYIDWMTGEQAYKYRFNPEELVKWKVCAFKSIGARNFVRRATGLRESVTRLKQVVVNSPLNHNGCLQSLVARFRRQGGAGA